MRYAFIQANQGQWPVTRMLAVLGISSSGYYAWRDCSPSARAQLDAALTEKIAQIHQMSHATYSTPRLQALDQGRTDITAADLLYGIQREQAKSGKSR